MLGITQTLYVKIIHSLVGTATSVQNTTETLPVLLLFVTVSNMHLHGSTIIISRHPDL